MSDAALHLAAAVPVRRLRSPLSPQSLIVLLAIVVGLVATGSSLLTDPDTQWHIAVGQQIWAAKAVPTTDLYSYTFAGAPWIAKEWLSQLILYVADAAGGWRGVVLVTALAIGLAFALIFAHLERRLHLWLAAVMTMAGLILAVPHMLARPHMLVLPIVVGWTCSLLAARERDRVPPLAFALVMTVWTNMHGSFPLGLVLAGVLALEGVAMAPRPERLARLARWALFLALATAATLVSPYGLDAILVPLRMEGNAETLKYVSEWVPLRLDALGVLAVSAAVLSLAALLPRWRGNLFRLVLVGLLAALMVRHVRFVSLFGVLAPLLVAAALARWPRLAATGEAPPAALWGAVGALAAAALVAVAIATPAPAARVTPEAAYRAAMDAGVAGPVLNDYDFGGYLIAHGVKTFVDGRTDQLFLGDFLPGYVRALDAKDDAAFAAILARYHVTWALVRAGSREARHLSHMPGWSGLHTDAVASVFVRR